MTLNQPAPASLSHAGVGAVAAHRRALRDCTVVHRSELLRSALTAGPITTLLGGVVMPNAHLDVRDHFRVPASAQQFFVRRHKLSGTDFWPAGRGRISSQHR
jgi:hypothetical protein